MFKMGDVVRLNRPVPQGPVTKMRMDDDGTIWYLVSWTGDDGQSHERWFTGDDLVAAE
jgi:hypothetical protein